MLETLSYNRGSGANGPPQLGPFVFGGVYVAFFENKTFRSLVGTDDIVVVSLQTRARRDIAIHAFNGDPSDAYRLEAITVGSQGFVGWRDVERRGQGPAETVNANDSHGTRQLDSAKPGDLQGPTIAGAVVSWQNTGVTKTADLS